MCSEVGSDMNWAGVIVYFYGRIYGLVMCLLKIVSLDCILCHWRNYRTLRIVVCAMVWLGTGTFLWRRNLLVWELQLEKQLDEVLAQAGFKSDSNDRRIWCLQNSGTFSTKSFTEAVVKLQVGD